MNGYNLKTSERNGTGDKTINRKGIGAGGVTAERPESLLNLTGKTLYIDDLEESARLLHAAPVPSPSARGRGLGIDPSAALAMDPSVRVFTAADLPGENQIGTALDDEPLLADGEWNYKGEVVALVVAKDRTVARAAAQRVVVRGEDLEPNFDARVAAARGDLILKPMTLEAGDAEAALARACWLVRGRADSGGQEHVYLETQSAVAYPEEDGRLRVVSGTQAPSGVRKAIARTLSLSLAQVEVETPRLGGAFGGKEDQAAPWACLAALGARLTGRPVKLVLSRHDDMAMTGKRHPYSADFAIGLDSNGMIVGLSIEFYQNSGAVADLSPAILSRTLFHAAGAYNIPAVRVTGKMCRTNLPPFTAFRGFGAPQAYFVIESAIMKASEASGIDPLIIQERNLLYEGDVSHYGQRLTDCRARRSVEALDAAAALERSETAVFNAANRARKRGSWLLPICFGVSFTKTMMNQGGALVHVFTDGSVSVATGAVEMGQGVNRKVLAAVAATLGIDESLVRVERTSTATVANTMPTAASTGADINGMAALVAARQIRERLDAFAAGLRAAADPAAPIETGSASGSASDAVTLPWPDLVARAHVARIDLSAHGFWATPDLSWDEASGKGTPFAYYVYGAALVIAEIDALRGRVRIVGARLAHDGGVPIDALVDRGQIEGGFAQGLGWALLEELRYDENGGLVTDSLSTYKTPDARFMDFPIDIEFLSDAFNPKALLGSKAVGEPPFLFGIAGYFAAMRALKAARPGPAFFDLPLSAEKALAYLMGGASCFS